MSVSKRDRALDYLYDTRACMNRTKLLDIQDQDIVDDILDIEQKIEALLAKVRWAWTDKENR